MSDPYYREMIEIEEAKAQSAIEQRQYLKKEGFGKFYPCEERTAQKIKKHNKVIKKNLENYENITTFERKKNMFLAQRWTFLTKIKNMQFDEKRAYFKRILYAGNFIKLQKSVAIYQAIMQTFLKRKQEIRKKNNAFFVSMIISIIYRQKIKIFGPTLEDRNINLMKRIFSFGAFG